MSITKDELVIMVQNISADARKLNFKHTNKHHLPINYVCIFSQNEKEYDELINSAKKLGSVADSTSTGPVFYIEPLTIGSDILRILKIRRPDPNRPQRGDADFTVDNFDSFKKEHLSKPFFNLIKREKMEMVELIDPDFDVLAYYSHPILAEILGLDISK